MGLISGRNAEERKREGSACVVARCFEGLSYDSFYERTKFSIASWVLINPIFHGKSVDQVMLNWKEVAGLNVRL